MKGSIAGRRVNAPASRACSVSARPTQLAARRCAAPVQCATKTFHEVSVSKSSSSEALNQLKAQQKSGGGPAYAQEAKSVILTVGLSVHSAPVDVRERLAVPQAEWGRAIGELTAFPHIEEAGVLSTCNRMEVYVVARSWHRGVREVEAWMCQQSGLTPEELRPYLFLLRGRDATSHVLNVSAGLDSLVMGEGQILAQVKAVFEEGQSIGGFGRQLDGLFKHAIIAGKRVRAETNIAKGAVSVSSAAAELAQLKLPGHTWDHAKVCIIGAGKMSRLLVKHLLSKGCTDMIVVNRSTPRVEELQEDFPDANIECRLLPDLMSSVEEANVVFVASGSETLLINKEDAEKMAPACEEVGGLRRYFDISVPRNVDAAVSDIPHSHCYNVDDLTEVVEANKENRAEAAREASLLLSSEQQAFEAWQDSLRTVPTIKALRGKAEKIRLAELEKAVKYMGDSMTKKQRKAVEEMSRSIVNKLLHGPMQALRSDGSDPAAVDETLANMHALERMFSLAEQEKAGRKGR